MSAPNVSNIYRSPGRLVKNPTDLSAAYPHGGTEIGIARDMLFRPNIKTRQIVAEEFKTPVEVLFTGSSPIMAGVMRTWDNDIMTTLFPETQTSSRGDVGVLGSVSTRGGKKMSSRAITLLFSPMAVDLHKHILIYNAIPVVEEAFEMKLSLAEELGIPFFFQAAPDAAGRMYAIDLRANLTL